jgi:hypothetical protein
MPQINLKQPGQPVSDFSVTGSLVTVAGVAVDCAERQLDTSVSIEVRANSNGIQEGGDGAYLAQIEIPARRYVEVETTDEDGKPMILRDPVELDPNAVVITLWPTA